MNLLLLSNSRTPGGFLTDHLPRIAELAAGARRALFVPFAAVTAPWADYAKAVREAFATLRIELVSIEDESVTSTDFIVVGGGNTFHLLHHLRKRGLLEPIRARVRGGAKYLGWSAGANLACPTIKTTNDMPVVDPGGLQALGLVPFQINPHYTNALPEGHQGETRNQRLAEFARVNPDLPVIGLPEGDWIRVASDAVELGGPHPAVWFSRDVEAAPLSPGRLRLGDAAQQGI